MPSTRDPDSVATLYAIPALAGATVAVLGDQARLPVVPVALTRAAVCLTWRLTAMWRN